MTNQELTQKFNQIFATPHSNLRYSVTPKSTFIFVQRAQGARIWDVEGKDYIDYLLAYGPNILGHRHSEYIQGLREPATI